MTMKTTGRMLMVKMVMTMIVIGMLARKQIACAGICVSA